MPPPVVLEIPPPPAPPELEPEPAAAAASGDGPTPAEQALAGFTAHSRCSDFDYYPEGGLQNLWCHRDKGFELADIGRIAQRLVFGSGPHRSDALELHSPDQFGHYDPGFVAYLVDKGVSAPGSVGQRATQGAYDRHLKSLAHILWVTRQKLDENPACLAREKKLYEAAMRQKKVDYYERWFYFMNRAFCGQPRSSRWYMDNGFDGGVDGNVTKSAVGFWLRRSMDGSYDAFGKGLRKLIETYEPALARGDLDLSTPRR